MAIKGLSRPVIGDYIDTAGAITYANPMIANKAVEYSTSLTAAENNDFYADNGIAENDNGTFQSGEINLVTADIPQALSLRILGTKTVTETAGEDAVTVQVYDDDRKAPHLGFGVIELHQENNEDKYRAVFLHRVYFNVPDNAATTKGETIDWQTPQITGSIMRSDAMTADLKHPWMSDAWFDEESKALAWLEFKCGKAAE